MNKEQYVSTRVDDQIDWYNQKSLTAQRRFKALRGFEIIAAALIPIIAGFGGEEFPVTLVLGTLGALIAVVAALISLNQYQENWIAYRCTSEALKHEKFLFITGAEPYNTEEAFSAFVHKVEGIVSRENDSWSQYAQTSGEQSREAQ